MRRGAYYNDNEPYAAAWLKNLIEAGLIADGDVDGRDIRDVQPGDLRGYTRCHFFAGIGGWSYALRLAGWPDDRPVWTGSCPCQPFSDAGKRKGLEDERHLWPEWFRLIRECRPATIFGEQVARAVRHGWLDTVAGDLEREGYAIGAALLPACAVAAPQERERLWFVARAWRERSQIGDGLQRRPQEAHTAASAPYTWPVESAFPRVAYGVPARVAKVRALGNAIVPQVAAEFIRACM